MKSLVYVVGLVVILSLITGCAPLYSEQKYGNAGVASGFVTVGKTSISEVISALGKPSGVYESGSNMIYIFYRKEGISILWGIFENVKKKDFVVIADKSGIVKKTALVDTGEGLSILGFISPIFQIDK